MLVVGEALDAEEVPGPECVEEEAFLGALSARSHFERLGWLAFQREGEDGAAFGNVDVVVETFVRRASFVELPGGRVEILGDEGVIFEDEEEGPLAEVRGGRE